MSISPAVATPLNCNSYTIRGSIRRNPTTAADVDSLVPVRWEGEAPAEPERAATLSHTPASHPESVESTE